MTVLRQPPLGGCELKQRFGRTGVSGNKQPPLGGCELKPGEGTNGTHSIGAAAFGRL